MQYRQTQYSINEIKRRIEHIDNLNSRKTPIEEYENIIYQLMSNVIAHSYFIPKGDKPIICRARTGEYSKISDLMNPPEKYVKELGRMNDIKESKFYSCIGINAKLGSLDEIRVKSGDMVTQLFFKVTKQIEPIIGIGHSKHWLTNKPLNELSKLGLKESELKKQTLITNWLHKAFLKKVEQPDLYKKTIAISRVYQHLFNPQAIMFPSVSSQGSTSNIVLPSIVAENNLEPISARVIQAHTIEKKSGFLFKYVKESQSIDLRTGIINWQEQSQFNDDAKALFETADPTKVIKINESTFAFPHPTDSSKFLTYSTSSK